MVLHIHKELNDGLDLKTFVKSLYLSQIIKRQVFFLVVFVYLKIFNSCHVNTHNVKIHYYPESNLVLPT